MVTVRDEEHLGPAMLALTPPRRAFVTALISTGARSWTQAAEMAGIGGNRVASDVAASRLMRQPSVLAAIREEADVSLRGGALLAAKKLYELIDNPDPKIAYKAAVEVLNRSGLIVATQHNVVVEDHRDTDSLRDAVRDILLHAAQSKNVALPAPQENVVEGDFVEVDDLSDLMGPG